MNGALELVLYGTEYKEDVINERKARRMAIAYIFIHVLGAPAEAEWDGTNGAIPKIRKALDIPEKSPIKSILYDILEHKRMGLEYKGDRIITDSPLGRTPILTLDSPEAQIVADAIEDGLSIVQTTMMCNEHRRQEQLIALTKAPIEGLIKKMKPLVTKITKTKQGNRDANSPWARGRYGWSTQILVRLGTIEGQKKEDGTIPDYWNPDKMSKLKKTQISHWDETHKKCTIGGIGAGTVEYRVRFPRDENGKLDLGTYHMPVLPFICAMR